MPAMKLVKAEEVREQDTPIEVFRTAVGPELNDAELMLAIEYASRRKLDLITKQIIPTVMKSRDGTRRLTFITTIDGLRVIAERSGKYGGQDAIVYGTDDKGQLEWAEATVYRKDWQKPCTVRAYWREFAPDEVKWGTWKKMPHVMLGKVAEAQALRKAFPADMGGLYSGDEMEQAAEQPVEQAGELVAHPTITAAPAGGPSRRASRRSAPASTTTTPEAEASTDLPPSAGTEGELADEQLTDAAVTFADDQALVREADAIAGAALAGIGDMVAAAEAIFSEELPEPEPEPEPQPIKHTGDFPIRFGEHGTPFAERGAVMTAEELMTPRGNAVYVVWMADDKQPQGRIEVVMAAALAERLGVRDLGPGEVINVEGKWTTMADRKVVVSDKITRE